MARILKINKDISTVVIKEESSTISEIIQKLKKENQMAEEFQYFNKSSHYYDWMVVPYAQRNMEEYLTVSFRVFLMWIGNYSFFVGRDDLHFDWGMDKRGKVVFQTKNYQLLQALHH